MFNFNQMLRDAKVDIAAASIDGIEFELFTQRGVAEAYDKHEWSVIHHPEIAQISHAVPPMEETHTTPWEEWFRWKGELRHHILCLTQQPESTETWQGESDDQYHPPQVIGPEWHVYNDSDATPKLLQK